MRLARSPIAMSAALLLLAACSDRDAAGNQAAMVNEASDNIATDDSNNMAGMQMNELGNDNASAPAEPVAKPKTTPAPKAAPEAPPPPAVDPHAGHDMNNM